MLPKSPFFFAIIVSLSPTTLKAADIYFEKEADSVANNLIQTVDTFTNTTIDTLNWSDKELKTQEKITARSINAANKFRPDSKKAVLYALFPGGGQLYNRKYWKLPIVYGGFIGLAYAVSWNGRYYGEYRDAYAAIVSEDRFSENNLSKWSPFLRPGVNINDLSNAQIVSLQNSFLRNRDSYRRYRDLSIIGMVALYALTIIDAYVDAQLFDFDISPDISLRVEPSNISESGRFSDNKLGIQCSLRF